MTEPRTVRDGRLAIRDSEREVERIHMAPAAALAPGAGWYLRKARLALRQAERALAERDDPRLEPLEPLRPQLRDRRPSLQPRRRRYRCPECFREFLEVPPAPDQPALQHKRCGVDLEPVRPLRRRRPRKAA